MALSTEDISICVIAVYCSGTVITMMCFILYWYVRTSTQNLVLLFWVGFAFALVWPLYLCPCVAMTYYFSTRFFYELFASHPPQPSRSSKPDALPYVKGKPRIVRTVDPTLLAHTSSKTICTICQSRICIKASQVRDSNLGPDVKISRPVAKDKDTTFTVCGHVYHYSCLQNWFKQKQVCPQCSKAQTIKDCILIYKSGKTRHLPEKLFKPTRSALPGRVGPASSCNDSSAYSISNPNPSSVYSASRVSSSMTGTRSDGRGASSATGSQPGGVFRSQSGGAIASQSGGVMHGDVVLSVNGLPTLVAASGTPVRQISPGGRMPNQSHNRQNYLGLQFRDSYNEALNPYRNVSDHIV